jgi:hypothetical protein
VRQIRNVQSTRSLARSRGPEHRHSHHSSGCRPPQSLRFDAIHKYRRMPREIANADLKDSDLPPPEAEWHEVGRFALSFNGYEWWGSFGQCAEVANRNLDAFREREALPDSLAQLRTCLFFEQRRWRHFGLDPDEEAMLYVRALLEKIRRAVRDR